VEKRLDVCVVEVKGAIGLTHGCCALYSSPPPTLRHGFWKRACTHTLARPLPSLRFVYSRHKNLPPTRPATCLWHTLMRDRGAPTLTLGNKAGCVCARC
jgi:hypothetical protein